MIRQLAEKEFLPEKDK